MISKHYYITSLLLTFPLFSIAQGNIVDTLQNKALEEVVVTYASKNKSLNEKQPLASVDDYLAQQESVTLVRRGAYAWEPMINNMAIERTRQTIDGMQIFHACTDKMDPITSYVEVNNLEGMDITSGSQGSMFGATLGGSIDLRTRKLSFTEEKTWKGQVQTGVESINKQKIIGGNFDYTTKKFYVSGSIMYRDADNYKAGRGKEIQYSQFRKLNASGFIGYAINPTNRIEAAVIYDKATDVGYPALPMDVGLAEAIITSVKHVYTPKNSWIDNWETKLYYNTITHRMDDTNRPDVAMRMDMPGWSDTYGAYSTLSATLKDKHHISINANTYYNKSLAEMTMISNTPGATGMFAYTWPNVKTNYGGLTIKDHWQIDDKNSLMLSGTLGINFNHVSEKGVNQLSIFLNDDTFKQNKTRTVGNLAMNYERFVDTWLYGIGVGYGNRAPSVSEGYGYYLFNSGDKYDYIGNPNLKNESSYEGNFFIKYATPAFSSKLSGSIFYLDNYIIGVIDPVYNAMTYGGLGLKKYENIDYAIQGSLDWNFTYNIDSNWKVTGGLTYSYGEDSNKNTLPFISPLAYRTAIDYKYYAFKTQLSLKGNAVKNNAAEAYGEVKTPAYAILDWNAHYDFAIKTHTLNVGIGIENIFDTYYSTYSDWNKIPNPGRNFFVNLSYKL
ncbi:TonB-dependent receptor plug domain-containing protein [Myroides pelagicus]|uniref:TonB-dependent receptor n=1 Tax=Myroides pelagicus TaxID=270914 RepID=A0A7K1GQN7_9FLAO|nr:TonB-dependent receptor plug domain-containing protein [Myroides pelagicus]MEC4114669.1 TonB-dependent receptor plug domain-containing protein [Myroides pelagicus]MTH30829.1 TonB-dependent receptor [Myroides pelagicus]